MKTTVRKAETIYKDYNIDIQTREEMKDILLADNFDLMDFDDGNAMITFWEQNPEQGRTGRTFDIDFNDDKESKYDLTINDVLDYFFPQK